MKDNINNCHLQAAVAPSCQNTTCKLEGVEANSDVTDVGVFDS